MPRERILPDDRTIVLPPIPPQVRQELLHSLSSTFAVFEQSHRPERWFSLAQ
jgi:hypothetical protein